MQNTPLSLRHYTMGLVALIEHSPREDTTMSGEQRLRRIFDVSPWRIDARTSETRFKTAQHSTTESIRVESELRF